MKIREKGKEGVRWEVYSKIIKNEIEMDQEMKIQLIKGIHKYKLRIYRFMCKS